MNRPLDRDTGGSDRPGASPSPRPGSSPSDTRSNAATGLTQQGMENQRPGGERHDASSEMQAGSTRDARLAQPGSLGTHDSERGKLGPQAHQQSESAQGRLSPDPRAASDERLRQDSMLDEEDPGDPRDRA